MLKIVEIVEVVPYCVVCRFNTGEVKKIELEAYIIAANNNVNKEKLLDESFFKQIRIGQFGELYWLNAAYMKNSNGELTSCEYDLSPEFVYHNATDVLLSKV